MSDKSPTGPPPLLILPDVTTPRFSLRLEEFKYLTGEISARSKELGDLERYIILGVAAIYTWLLSGAPPVQRVPGITWWLPFALCALGAVRTILYQKTVADISRYLSNVHKTAYGLEGTWESSQCKEYWDHPYRWVLGYAGGTSGILWVVMLIATLFVGILHGSWFACGQLRWDYSS
jgi:hypothetical protein